MPDEEKTEPRLEIAHVLFMDIVGYSALVNDEQREALYGLNAVVRNTDAVREAEAAGQLIRLPTGDGMALVFTSSVEAPVECALEISQGLRAQPRLPLRMGIHSGPVQRVEDVNGRENIAGAGINIAQRVMDCGDAGHILISRHVADDLAGLRRWVPYLHDLGDLTVKHGVVVSLVNLYADVIGNPAPPAGFGRGGDARRKLLPTAETLRASGRRRWLTGAGAFLIVAGLALAAWQWNAAGRRAGPTVAPGASVAPPVEPVPVEAPEKSVAVLPFENLSADKENAFFTDGVQGEILTDLAKIADLRVISRTSVMQYKDTGKRDGREIGRQLGVAHLLEGSVQRAGGRVRVTALLIDARTGAQQWGERYDRSLDDVFTIESEIAGQIVGNLKARLSPDEKKAIDARPTTNLEAYDLYLQAKEVLTEFQTQRDYREPLFKTLALLGAARTKDPDFALAACLEAKAHDQLYWLGIDHTPTRLALEEAAVADALRLQPGLGEAHLARALLLYHGSFDFDGARAELAVARRTLPNSAEVFAATAYFDRRQGRWKEAVSNQRQAVSLDPRNANLLNDLIVLFDVLRLYREEEAVADAAILAAPQQATFFRLMKAEIGAEAGRTADCRRALATLPDDYDPSGGVTFTRVCVALYERKFAEAAQALQASKAGSISDSNGTMLPRAWIEGLIYRAMGDDDKARGAMLVARSALEAGAHGQPEDAATLSLFGRIDAALGRKENALREGRRAVELRPTAVDAISGPAEESALALIYAWTGETEQAFALLGPLSKLPGGPHYGELRYDPAWDALRKDRRFAPLIAAMEPR